MNHAEGNIGGFKTHFRRIMNWWQCPETLWCFGALYTVHPGFVNKWPIRNLNDRSALEAMTGKTLDISTFTDFDFYEFVIYYDPNDRDDEGMDVKN
jgi:hypothetical protein